MKGTHPYIVGLVVLGGMYYFGVNNFILLILKVEGVLLGPILFYSFILLISFLKNKI
jgi:hypothetical protein